jgi:ribose transport system permease protein
VPWPLALGIGVVLGGATGLLNGLLVTLIRIPSFITTLAMMSTFRGVALLISGGSAVAGLPDGVSAMARTRFLGLPVVLWLPIVAIPLLGFVLSRTNLGLSIYAIGGNREAARIAGVAISRTRVIVLLISGLMAGLAAVIMTARLGVGSPIIASTLAMDAITAVVIGGTSLFGGAGRMSGTVLGVVLIASLQNGLVLLDVSAYWQQIAVGVVLVVAVAVDALSGRRRG